MASNEEECGNRLNQRERAALLGDVGPGRCMNSEQAPIFSASQRAGPSHPSQPDRLSISVVSSLIERLSSWEAITRLGSARGQEGRLAPAAWLTSEISKLMESVEHKRQNLWVGTTRLRNCATLSVLSTSRRRMPARRASPIPNGRCLRSVIEWASVEITNLIPRLRASFNQRGSISSL